MGAGIGTMMGRTAQTGRLLYLPPIIVRLALGGSVDRDGDDVVMAFHGDEKVAMSEEDFVLASKIAVQLRQSIPHVLSASAIINAVGDAHRLLSEEMFRAGAVRVLYFPVHAPGSLFYRCLMPAIAMNAGVRAKAFVSKNRVAREASDFDVVVFQIDHSPPTLHLVRQLQGMGKKCVFELDDAFDALEEWHSNSEQYSRAEEISQVTEMMKTCDAVVVSTQWLADRYRSIARRIEVIPNMIPLSDWERAKEGQHPSEFRILWAGSPSHWGDLELVGKALTRFVTDRDERGVLQHPTAKLIFFGREPVGLGLPKGAFEVHDFVDFSVYPQKLADLQADVAIAPLANVPFNLAKSNVKLLEYWATGYPVVASAVGPYLETIESGVNGILCETEDEWVGSLDALYRDRELRGEIRKGGMEAVKGYDSSRLIGRVEDFFCGLAKG